MVHLTYAVAPGMRARRTTRSTEPYSYGTARHIRQGGGVAARRLAQWPFTLCARPQPHLHAQQADTYAPAPGRSGSGRTLTRSGVEVAIAPARSSSVSCPGKAASSSAASPADGRASTPRTKTTEGRESPDANRTCTKSWSAETRTRSSSRARAPGSPGHQRSPALSRPRAPHHARLPSDERRPGRKRSHPARTSCRPVTGR